MDRKHHISQKQNESINIIQSEVHERKRHKLEEDVFVVIWNRRIQTVFWEESGCGAESVLYLPAAVLANRAIVLSDIYSHKPKHSETLDTVTLLNRMVRYLPKFFRQFSGQDFLFCFIVHKVETLIKREVLKNMLKSENKWKLTNTSSWLQQEPTEEVFITIHNIIINSLKGSYHNQCREEQT